MQRINRFHLDLLETVEMHMGDLLLLLMEDPSRAQIYVVVEVRRIHVLHRDVVAEPNLPRHHVPITLQRHIRGEYVKNFTEGLVGVHLA